ncbi:MAG: tRNA lysidine(34) synthetase TilS [Puniceicoccales bacterium]|nr:tRNA lysidine(34) synthetase TilS [Puniceicoccales bacterium]
MDLPQLDEKVLAVAGGPLPLCVACSGGSDSTALLHLLYGRKELRPRLAVLHYDHGLRPVASEGDCAFVQELSGQLGLPFFWERRMAAGSFGEDALRRDRMNFFRKIMAQLASPYLLTAHQKDDACETLLLRLGRGSGLEGLTAPRAVERFRDGTIRLRPLLHATKADLIRYLNVLKLPWREDVSNWKPIYVRNRVRNELLPLWRAIEGRRDLGRSLARSRELLQEDADALAELANSLYRRSLNDDALLLPPSCTTPRALIRRLLHLFFLDRGHVLSKVQSEGILRRLGEKFQLAIGIRLICRSDGAKLSISATKT